MTEITTMQLLVQRYMKGSTHAARFYLLHGEPKPGMYDYMLTRKLSELARLWALVSGRFVEERTDANAALAQLVPAWKDVTLSQLSTEKGFEFTGDPITVAAIEEATRRALDVLITMDDYAGRYTKQEEAFELGREATPTGLPAVPPIKKE
jgi:hypothetical protein